MRFCTVLSGLLRWCDDHELEDRRNGSQLFEMLLILIVVAASWSEACSDIQNASSGVGSRDAGSVPTYVRLGALNLDFSTWAGAAIPHHNQHSALSTAQLVVFLSTIF